MLVATTWTGGFQLLLSPPSSSSPSSCFSTSSWVEHVWQWSLPGGRELAEGWERRLEVTTPPIYANVNMTDSLMHSSDELASRQIFTTITEPPWVESQARLFSPYLLRCLESVWRKEAHPKTWAFTEALKIIRLHSFKLHFGIIQTGLDWRECYPRKGYIWSLFLFLDKKIHLYVNHRLVVRCSWLYSRPGRHSGYYGCFRALAAVRSRQQEPGNVGRYSSKCL